MKLVFRLIAFILLLSGSACAGLFSGGQGTLNITFSNQTKFDICEIYISTEKANDWGENRLAESETVAAGAEKTFTVKSGKYDLLVRNCSKEALYSYRGLTGDFTAVIGGPNKLPIRALNAGAIEICYIYIVPAGAGAWGEDQLGGVESIVPGATRVFFVEPGLVNLRAEDCNKNILSEVQNYDPASSMEWTIRP